MLLKEADITTETLFDFEKLNEHISKDYAGWYSQIKANGDRAVVSVREGEIIGIRNRRGQPQLFYYPELTTLQLPFKEAILDCEVVIEDKEGKSHFYNEKDGEGKITQAGIQFRNRTRKSPTDILKSPVTLVVFDILKSDDEILITKPYKYRYDVLKNKIMDNCLIRVAKNYSFEEAWAKVKEKDLEGVVVKNPNSVYEIGKRSSSQIKVKNYKATEVMVERTEQNDKGTKIYGKNPEGLSVECQIPNAENITIGSKVKIKYLERIGNKLTQPTKL